MLYLLLYCLGAVAAVLVREDDIASAVKTEFVNNGVEDELDLEFFGGQTSFSIAGASSFKIMITSLKFSEQQDKFSCRAEIYADGKLFATTDLTGKFYRIGEISVPARDIGKGEIIHCNGQKLLVMQKKTKRSLGFPETPLRQDLQRDFDADGAPHQLDFADVHGLSIQIAVAALQQNFRIAQQADAAQTAMRAVFHQHDRAIYRQRLRHDEHKIALFNAHCAHGIIRRLKVYDAFRFSAFNFTILNGHHAAGYLNPAGVHNRHGLQNAAQRVEPNAALFLGAGRFRRRLRRFRLLGCGLGGG